MIAKLNRTDSRWRCRAIKHDGLRCSRETPNDKKRLCAQHSGIDCRMGGGLIKLPIPASNRMW